jgi:glycosyltransferase involved in cell wall biosynthesis
MYSGIGRAVFEFARGMGDWAEFEFAIDDGTPKNTELVENFGRENELRVHVGQGYRTSLALDCGNADLPALLKARRWDAVECLCWANTATNAMLLSHLDREIPLAYTPHDQPTWTVAMTREQEQHLLEVHHRVLRRADVVFCDSPAERASLQALAPGRNHLSYLPLGCDFQQFRPGTWPRREQLLFVGDLAEPRKRFDRVLAVFSRLLENRPALRLVVIGNRSEEAVRTIPPELLPHCDLRGYVSESDLRRAYSESLGLFLLSDFEAFGIPILESLATSTPVFLNEQATTRSLFGGFAGAHFCDADSADSTLATVECVLARGRESVTEISAQRGRLNATFGSDELAYKKWRTLTSAWFRRRCWVMSA